MGTLSSTLVMFKLFYYIFHDYLVEPMHSLPLCSIRSAFASNVPETAESGVKKLTRLLYTN